MQLLLHHAVVEAGHVSILEEGDDGRLTYTMSIMIATSTFWLRNS